jgi:hypothetical protein
MLEYIFGNKTAEIVLLNIFHYGEIHASGIAENTGTAITPIKNQLDRFEKGGILVSKLVGRSRLYFFNKKSPLLKPVKELLRIVYEATPLTQREKLFSTRRRPRRKGKPIK